MNENHSVALFLATLFGVVFSAVGSFLIARMLKRKNEVVGELAFFAAFLITVGGLLNALGQNGSWMKNSLFVLLTPGFVCLAWALWRGLHDSVNDDAGITAGQVWLLPLFFNSGLLALTVAVKMVKGGRAWFLLLLTITTVAGIATSVQLARRALSHRQTFTAVLFLVNLVMTLTLNRMASKGVSAEATELAAGISNIISQSAFALAAYKLGQVESNKQ